MVKNHRGARLRKVSLLKKSRSHYWGYSHLGLSTDVMDARQRGKVSQYPQACSCNGCCNERRNTYAPKAEKRTRAERRYFQNYREQLDEFIDATEAKTEGGEEGTGS
jgi:hypothetical protein